MACAGDVEELASQAGLDKSTLLHMEFVNAVVGEPVIPLALWGDAVPNSWDKKQSAEMWTVSLPGLPEESPYKALRVPLVTVPHDLVVPMRTMDDILSILGKSMLASMQGLFPQQRLDGKDFTRDDAWRKKKAGEALKARSCIAEMRGDWKMQKDLEREKVCQENSPTHQRFGDTNSGPDVCIAKGLCPFVSEVCLQI